MVDQAKLRCSAVLRRILLIGLRSTSPHLVKSGSTAAGGWPVTTLARPLSVLLRACSLTSSMEIRPSGPDPATWFISTPISRARRRTGGAAGATRWKATACRTSDPDLPAPGSLLVGGAFEGSETLRGKLTTSC